MSNRSTAGQNEEQMKALKYSLWLKHCGFGRAGVFSGQGPRQSMGCLDIQQIEKYLVLFYSSLSHVCLPFLP